MFFVLRVLQRMQQSFKFRQGLCFNFDSKEKKCSDSSHSFCVKELRKKLDAQVKTYRCAFPSYVAEQEWKVTSVFYFAVNGTVPSWAEAPLGHEHSDRGTVPRIQASC